MIDADEFYRRIERKMVGEFKTTGAMESGFWQSVGKQMSAGESKRGQMLADMLGNIERMMTGMKKHGFEQNKKTLYERMVEQGRRDDEGRSGFGQDS